MALWRFGRGWPENIMKAYLADLADQPVNFDCPIEDMAPEKGWTVDGTEEPIGTEPPGPPVPDSIFDRARQGIVNYDFSDPRIVEGHYDPDTPFVGRNILLEMKVLGFRFLSGCRVHSVREETDGHRTYFGFYAHHDWTPVKYFTLSGGGRFDQANEDLDASFEELSVPSPVVESHDSQNVNDWSGDVAALVRLLPDGANGIEALNLYGSWKSSFKPAAPNLTEAEDAEILDPEHTHSIEGGVKARGLNGQLSLDVSGFQMDFTNMVVTILDASSQPVNVNAGRERFKGWEVALTAMPQKLPGLSLSGSYAWHDPRFVEFSFVEPDGGLVDASGNFVEMAPRLMWSVRAAYARERGPGAWVAVRHQGERALSESNAAFDQPFSEYDAGLTYEMPRVRVSVVGRNLGDSRHYVAVSELGESQLYVAPKRRFTAQVTLPF